MRICMLTYSFYESDSRVQQYASALVERGDEVDVVALRRNGLPAHEVLGGVSLNRIQYRRKDERNQAAYLFRISRFLMHSALFITRKHLSRRYDVIHVHSVPDFMVFAALVPKLLGAGVILDIHDILPEFYASKFHTGNDSLLFKTLLLVERRSVRFADFTIVANDLWCERVKARSARNGSCMAIRNYPNPKIFVPRAPRKTNGKFVILYPGTLNQHQGVDIAVRAFAKIKDQIPGAEFQIYGEGPAKPYLRSLGNELGLNGSLKIKDYLPTSEIVQVMSKADLAVVPKRASSPFGNEAASTKIFEFMALGVPLIVSKTRIDTHYLNDSLVRFFESDNADDLARAMLAMVRQPELRERLVANAAEYAAQNTWDEKKEEYLRLVDRVANQEEAVQPLPPQEPSSVQVRD